jgi:excisionase family DNA binding protein
VLNLPDAFDVLVKEHFDGLPAPDYLPITDDARREFIAALVAKIADGLDAPGVACELVDLNGRDVSVDRDVVAVEIPAAEPLLLTLQEAAAYTGVPYTSLRKLVLAGHLPHVQLGDAKRTWVKRADVDQLIERSTKRA